MLWTRYVVGYHGCDASLAQKIVCQQDDLKPSLNGYDWLGDGIYFWEGSARRAMEWAEKLAKTTASPVKDPSVLGAVIDLGECLNLVETENLALVGEAYEILKAASARDGLNLPKNAGQALGHRLLDGAVFEALHAWRHSKGLPEFDTVRAFFMEGEPIYPSSGLRPMDHIQICVRNPAQIIGYFLPR